jgi:hypothetical protein
MSWTAPGWGESGIEKGTSGETRARARGWESIAMPCHSKQGTERIHRSNEAGRSQVEVEEERSHPGTRWWFVQLGGGG